MKIIRNFLRKNALKKNFILFDLSIHRAYVTGFLSIIIAVQVPQTSSYAQGFTLADHQLPKNYALPSPEALGITKVADVPVDLATGQVNISIPLYTIQTGKLTLPVSLSYDASGIRVEQEAGEVGLGWSLQAGGAITRRIRDKDDYQTSISYHGLGGDLWDSHIPDPIYPTMAEYDIAYKVASLNTADGQPDLYMYNAVGLTGKFINTGTANGIKLIPRRNVAVAGGYNSWAIIDERGYNYQFGDENNDIYYETNNLRTLASSVGGNADNAQMFRMAWYLKQITDAEKVNSINFEYQKTHLEYDNGRTQTQIYENGNFDYFSTDHLIDAAESRTIQRTDGSVIKKISFNEGTIEFINSMNNREDLLISPTPAQPRLESIIVKNRDGDIIKKINFGYSYFVAPNITNPTLKDKRLRLDFVTIENGNLPAEKYTFSYSNILPPSKKSFAQDHWGYYNGKDGNSTLIPSYSFLNHSFFSPMPDLLNCSTSKTMFNGAYRETDAEKVKAGVLTKIQYPTGGTVSFDFECHDINQTDDPVYDYEHIKPPCFVFKTSGTSYECPDGTISNNAGNTGIVKSTYLFTIPSNSFTASGVHAKFSALATWGGAATTIIQHSASAARLEKENTNGTYNIVEVFTYDNPNRTSSLEDCNDNILLGPGNYRVIAQTSGIGIQVRAYFETYVPKQILSASTIKKVGGLRIKSITYNDMVTGTSSVRNYLYKDISDQSKSSGYTFSPITSDSYVKSGYLYWGDKAKSPECWHWPSSEQQPVHIPCCFRQVSSLILSSTTNVETGDGANVNYEYVTITEGTGQNGKVVQQFNRAPGINLSYLDGLPLHTWVYDLSNILVQEVKNEYNSQPGTEEFFGYKITAKSNHPCAPAPDLVTINAQPGAGYGIGYDWKSIRMRSEWIALTQKKTTQYFPGSNPLTTVEEYTYNPLNLEPARIDQTISDGRKTTQRFKYPVDYNSIGTNPDNELNAVLVLNNQHVHNQVVEKYTSIPDLSGIEQIIAGSYIGFSPVLSSQVTEMTPEGPVSHYTAAQSDNLFSLEPANPLTSFQASHAATNGSTSVIEKDPGYKLQYSVLKYDTRLNPLETKDEHGTRTALIWIHNAAILATEVSNAAQSEIAYSSFEDPANSGNWDYDNSAIVGSDRITGVKCYNLSGNPVHKMNLPQKDYVISFWSKTPGVIVNGQSQPTLTGATIKGWTYYEYLSSAVTSVTVSGSGLVDELRLYPLGASMKTWCHTPLVGVNTTCDERNNIQYYEYDVMGRLSVVRDHYGNIIKKMDYGIQQAD